MKRSSQFITAAATALVAAPLCLAQTAAGPATDKTLSVGDKAPAIDIAHWIKGDNLLQGRKLAPITKFQDGKVYVLEFWATWCGPCRAGMPHVTKLQQEYKDYDVTIVGISDEPLPTVIDFLFQTDASDGETYQQRTGYTLCTDPDRSVFNDYMKAAGQNGIPTAFIIGKDGHVEWIGHPMRMDEPLDAIVHDKWDREGYARQANAQARAEREMLGARRELTAALQAGEWEKAVSIYDRLIKTAPNPTTLKVEKFQLLLKQINNPQAAYGLGNDILEHAWDNAMTLNQVAWFVVDEPGVQRRNLLFAMKAAERANELTEYKNAPILDTVARVYFEMGDLGKAIEWQKKAVANAGDDQMGADIRATLEKYTKAAKSVK